ncbi:ANTAR domain-containing response regulator [Alteribacillus bidgolensis]|uniref:Response regulator receiver and ANTAR domain protein n=1 Tax=Alteribacillus bidgolensis TaxID=930129 RepID=A0A1G8KFM2_9BACI|nr:response regulator [Alteribacillus bidgolensis]SDI42205.1 response regulator receiver and ANTAR domain protein [Alteribacillus bidgolensis]
MKQSKIMVVDDEPITRFDIKEILKEKNYQVVGEAKNGEEAIKEAYELDPDLILMDIKMPKVDGIKASSIIKEFSSCSILLLTAYSDDEYIDQAKKAGINAYVVKPVNEKELNPAVEIALQQRANHLKMHKKIGKLEEKIKERKIIEKAKGYLMDQQGFTEENAYRNMQKESMEHHIPLIEIANRILASHSK